MRTIRHTTVSDTFEKTIFETFTEMSMMIMKYIAFWPITSRLTNSGKGVENTNDSIYSWTKRRRTCLTCQLMRADQYSKDLFESQKSSSTFGRIRINIQSVISKSLCFQSKSISLLIIKGIFKLLYISWYCIFDTKS